MKTPRPFVCSQAVCEERFGELMRRVERAEDDTWRKEMWSVINGIRSDISGLRESIANLNGRLLGYVLAGTVLGGVLAAVAQLILHHVQK